MMLPNPAADTLADEAEMFLAFESLMTFCSTAARITTRKMLAERARELGVPTAEVEAAVDSAIKTAEAR